VHGYALSRAFCSTHALQQSRMPLCPWPNHHAEKIRRGIIKGLVPFLMMRHVTKTLAHRTRVRKPHALNICREGLGTVVKSYPSSELLGSSYRDAPKENMGPSYAEDGAVSIFDSPRRPLPRHTHIMPA